MSHTQALPLVSDYVLHLLSTTERERFEQHLAVCPHCHQAVLREQALVQAVRGTIAQAARPAPGRLARLMPPVATRRSLVQRLVWQPVAALALLFILFLGGSQLNQARDNNALAHPSATFLAVTATRTPVETATETASPTSPPGAEVGEAETVDRPILLPLRASPDPVPAATPVAALPPDKN